MPSGSGREKKLIIYKIV